MRMWYFGETERQAQEALTAVGKEDMADMENEMNFNSNFNGGNNNFPKKPENNQKPDEKKENK